MMLMGYSSFNPDKMNNKRPSPPAPWTGNIKSEENKTSGPSIMKLTPVAKMFATISPMEPLLTEEEIPSEAVEYIKTISASIDIKRTQSIINLTNDLDSSIGQVMSKLLQIEIDSISESIFNNLDDIKNIVKSSGFFSGWIISEDTPDQKITKIDRITSSLKYEIIKVKNQIDSFDSLYQDSLNKITEVGCYIIAVKLTWEFFEAKINDYNSLDKKMIEGNIELLKKKESTLRQLRMTLKVDPQVVLISKNKAVALINLVEGTIYGLIHEWKMNVQLKKDKKTNDLKEITNNLQRAIEGK